MRRVRKCRFSVTRISAPTHSAYAAIKASAGLMPLDSYFAPSSNGTRKSSLMVARLDMKPMNSRNVSGVKWRLTSSTVNRGIRKLCTVDFSSNKSSKDLEGSSSEGPKARIYSFESMTRTNFFFPNGLSRFPQCLNHIFLAHAKNGRGVLSYNLSYLSQMFLGLFNVGFCHAITHINQLVLLHLRESLIISNGFSISNTIDIFYRISAEIKPPCC